MKECLVVLNRLKEEKVIIDYAISGAFAALFYIEPIVTFDLDLLVLLPHESSLAPLSHLYEHLQNLGYGAEGEHVMIEGRPVQFLLPYNALVREAFAAAKLDSYDDVPVKVLSAEYLMAIMVQTGRQKDRQRLSLFLEEAQFDKLLFSDILSRYNLLQRFEQWTKNSTFNA